MDAQVKTVSELAREFMQLADWNFDKALKLGLSRSKSEPYVTDQVLRIGWESLLRNVANGQRELLTTRAKVSVDSNARLRQVLRESALDTWLIAGKPIGTCTADDLRRSIQSREANAETERKRAAFETAVLKKLKPGKTVRDCWTETDFVRLMGEML